MGRSARSFPRCRCPSSRAPPQPPFQLIEPTSEDRRPTHIVGSTTTTVLEELGAANDDDAAWATANINLSAYAGQTIRILVEAADASGASLVEAAIDDVRITQQ